MPPPKVSEKYTTTINNVSIVDVWNDNFHAELDYIIRELLPHCPCVAMDTEFPGVVVKPLGSWKTVSEFHYQTMRSNVNLLKIIQLGVTFADTKGNLPEHGRSVFQFNFRFDVNSDVYAKESIDLLKNSGINFSKHATDGIDVREFAEKIMHSGLVLNDDIKWISFHSGYDFGYFMKLLLNQKLPSTESDFFKQLKLYFPTLYDIKYMLKYVESLKNGGLNQLANDLQIQRTGPVHQAGSDSLLTLDTFMKLVKTYLNNNFNDPKMIGRMYGFGARYSHSENHFIPNYVNK